LQTLQAHPTSLLHYCSDSVWTMPLSLAATYGISIDFFSSRYSDVSFRRGSRSQREQKKPEGFFYEVAFGNPRISGFVLLPEAYRSLTRPSSSSKPSHPPNSVSASDDYIIDERIRNLCTTIITSGTDACYVLQPRIQHADLHIQFGLCSNLFHRKQLAPPIVPSFFLRR
jgi:hypothetical protein